MKRLVILICSLVFITGCGQASIGMSTEDDNGEVPEISDQNPGFENELEVENIIISDTEAEVFLSTTDITHFDEWIYYTKGSTSELWKCKLDLTDNSCVFPSGFGRDFIINPDGYLIHWKTIKPAYSHESDRRSH